MIKRDGWPFLFRWLKTAAPAHFNGPTLIIQEWAVVAELLDVILANDPTLELTRKYTQDGYEPGEIDVFFEYLGLVRGSDGSITLDVKACASRSPDGCYVPTTVSRIIDTVFNTVVAQHNPKGGQNLYVYFWGDYAAETLAKAYSEEKSKVAPKRVLE